MPLYGIIKQTIEGDTFALKTECPSCHSVYTVRVSKQEMGQYAKGGQNVQEAFPSLSVNDRERLISGWCPQCWDERIRGND